MEKSRDFLTGVVFFGLLLVLGIFSFFLADIRFTPAPEMSIGFDSLAGLEAGTEVRIDGFRSGKVKEVERRPGEAVIRVKVAFDHDPVIYEVPEELRRRRFRIASASVLGGTILEIDSGAGAAGPNPTLIDLAAEHHGTVAADPLAKAGELLEMVQGGQGTLGKLFTDPALWDRLTNEEMWDEIRGTAAEFRRFSAALNERDEKGRNSVDKLNGALSELSGLLAENRSALRGMLINLRDFSASLNREDDQGRNIVARANAVIDDLGRVVADNRDSLASTLKNFDRFSSALNETDENGRTPIQNVNRTLTELDAFAQALNDDGRTTLDRIERILKGVEDGKGTLGLIVSDKETAEKIRKSIESISDYVETTNENAPLTTFAGLILRPF